MPASVSVNQPLATDQHVRRVEFLDVSFDLLAMDEAIATLAAAPADTPFRYIVTPNVDHVVNLSDPDPANDSLRDAYSAAWLRLCDSRVLARLARMKGIRLPVVPGSDLTARFFREAIRKDDRIAIVGSSEWAVAKIARQFPGVTFLHHQPPMGLRHNSAAIDAAATFVAKSRARVIFFALGSPQQEMLVARIAHNGNATGIGLCIGASIDFLSGAAKRAPLVMQKAGLEWAHRLATSPRRLWRRYLLKGPRIFLITAKWRPRQP